MFIIVSHANGGKAPKNGQTARTDEKYQGKNGVTDSMHHRRRPISVPRALPVYGTGCVKDPRGDTLETAPKFAVRSVADPSRPSSCYCSRQYSGKQVALCSAGELQLLITTLSFLPSQDAIERTAHTASLSTSVSIQ